MKRNNLLNLSIKDLLKNKLNLLIVVILIVLGCIFVIGTSYYNAILKFYRDYTTNAYEFDLITFNPYEDIDRTELIEKLKKEEHVRDVFQYDEQLGYAIFDEYKELGMNGVVRLTGTIPKTKKIIVGNDLDYDANGIICPSKFYPDSMLYSGTYNAKKAIDLKDKVGSYLTFNFADKYKVSLKLIGLYDVSYDYSDQSECFVNHSTLKRLNNQYQPKIDPEKGAIKVLLDDINNTDFLSQYKEFYDYRPISTINTKRADNVLNNIKNYSLIVLVLGVSLIYLVYKRHIVNNYKNIGVLKVSGYSNSKIKKIYYIEALLIGIISIVICTFISLVVTHNFAKWFLFKEPNLSLITVNLNWISVIISFGVILLTILLSVFLALHKIKKLDISEIVYE